MRLLFPLLALFLMIPLDAFAGDQATATFLATDGLYCEGMSRQVLDDEALQVAQAVDKGTAKLDNFTRAFKKTCDLEGSLAAASTDKTTDAYLSVYGLYCDGMGRQLHDWEGAGAPHEALDVAQAVGAGTMKLDNFVRAFKKTCNVSGSFKVASDAKADKATDAFLSLYGFYCDGMSRQLHDWDNGPGDTAIEAQYVSLAVASGKVSLDNFKKAFARSCDPAGAFQVAGNDKATNAYLSLEGMYCDGMGRQLHDYDNEPAEIASGVGAGTLDLNDFTKAFKQSCNYKVSREVAKIQPADAKVEAPEAPAANGTAL